MKKSFTQQMTWMHTWSGLFVGWVLFAIFLTGTLCVFWMDINYWARPELHATKLLDPHALTQYSVDYLNKVAPDARRWTIALPDPDQRDPILILNYQKPNGANENISMVPDGSGRPITTWTQGGRFFVDFHWMLNVPPPGVPEAKVRWGFMVSGAAGLAFLIGCISGVIIHKKIFKDFFTFRPGAKSRQRSWLDAHNVLGVLPWPFHVMIVTTGLIFLGYLYIPSGQNALRPPGPQAAAGGAAGNAAGGGTVIFGRVSQGAGEIPKVAPPPLRGAPSANYSVVELLKRAEAQIGGVTAITIRNPNRDNAQVNISGGRDTSITFSTESRSFNGVTGEMAPVRPSRATPFSKFTNLMTGLHFAFFGGTPMRLLYFVCGAAGTAMMACGLLLFTAKRREKAHSPAAGKFYNFVDKMNVATIGGAMIACMGYLWAVRLLPYTFAPAKDLGVYASIRAMPLDQAARADWEIYSFWLIWIATFVHAFVRKPAKAWVEQLAVLAILCLGMPVIGYLVPNSGLFAMMAAGDWKVAGVDLTAFGFGVVFAWAAWKVSGKSFAKLMTPAPSLSPAE